MSRDAEEPTTRQWLACLAFLLLIVLCFIGGVLFVAWMRW